jgi:hypothetical protein
VKIISGFQSGADIAGIKAARMVGFETGGMIPKGWLTEYGPRPEYGPMYGATEHSSDRYPPRTYFNVKNSDATILFVSTRAKSERGCDLTKKACAELKKPALVIPVWSRTEPVISPVALAEKVRHHGFKVLNVAGSRGSSDPGEPGKYWTGIEGFTFSFCLALFEILKESES